MKVLAITVALMACTSLAMPQQSTGPAASGEAEGEVEGGMEMSDQDVFLMKLAKQVMMMKKAMMKEAKVQTLSCYTLLV